MDKKEIKVKREIMRERTLIFRDRTLIYKERNLIIKKQIYKKYLKSF